MTEEQWNELLEIAGKACLSPAPAIDHRYVPLELYLSALHTVYAIFTQEDRDRFADEFKGLSDEDKQRLLTHITNRTHPSSLHLSREEVTKLEAMRKELSLHERARLSCGFIWQIVGAVWLDMGEVSRAVVSIDCKSTPARERRPYAHIYFSDYYRRRVETIDIIESVKKDPVAIGHPAIAFAIHHWQQVIYVKNVIDRDDVTLRGELGEYAKDEYHGGKDLRSAEHCLKEISPTLYAAAKNRRIPTESAFALRMQMCGLLQDLAEGGSISDGDEEEYGSTVVFKAWEKLRAESVAKLFRPNEISKRSDPDEILKKIEPELVAFEGGMAQHVQPIYAHRVMEFLKDAGEKGGSRFVGLKADGKSPGQRWKAFCHAFAAWYFDLDQSDTVAVYLRRAKRQNIVIDNEGKVIPGEVYQPSMVYPQASLAWIFTNLLTRPLVAIREPFWLKEGDIIGDEMENAISRALNDGEGKSA